MRPGLTVQHLIDTLINCVEEYWIPRVYKLEDLSDYDIVLYEDDYWFKIDDRIALCIYPTIYTKDLKYGVEIVGYVKPEHREQIRKEHYVT